MNANAILAKTGFELNRATTQQRKSLVNLSSGKNQFLKVEDAGGNAVSRKLSSHKKIENSLSDNLQNMISFTKSQDGVLKNASRIVNRMSQLANLATNSLISDSHSGKFIHENEVILRIERSELALKSTCLASLNLKLNFNLTAIAQAKSIPQGLGNVLLN